MNVNPSPSIGKIPQVTFTFWVIKIAATTLGETGGDAVTMSMNLGYLVGSLIFGLLAIIAIAVQIRAHRFNPFLYWSVIIATTTVGTTLADFADRSLGIGYAGGASLLSLLLFVSLGLWYWSEGSVSMNLLGSRKAELFYWVTILCSQTLGTALGDFLADSEGFGYLKGAGVFGAAILVLWALSLFTHVSRTVLFWGAFILTRPLGATVGDLLDKPHSLGGLELDRYWATGILATFIVACIVIFPRQAGGHPGGAVKGSATD